MYKDPINSFALVKVLCGDGIDFIVVISLVSHSFVLPALATWVVLSIVDHLLNMFLGTFHVISLSDNGEIWVGASVVAVVPWNVHGHFEAVLDMPHFRTLGADDEPICPLLDFKLLVNNSFMRNWVMAIVYNVVEDLFRLVDGLS